MVDILGTLLPSVLEKILIWRYVRIIGVADFSLRLLGNRKSSERILVIPEGPGSIKIYRMDLKGMVKKILRKVPILFNIARYVYRKIKTLKTRATDKNYRLCILSITKSLTRIKNTPLKIQLEITNRCNLKCIMCARIFNPRYSSTAGFIGDMDLDLVKKIRPVLRGVSAVYTFGNGEPLLNSNFLNILRIISPFRPRISFNTNGTLLNEKKCREIVDLGIDCVVFSIDSPIKESFEKIRKGSDFDVVIRNIELLHKTKSNKKSKVPHIGFAIVAMKQNLREVPQLIKLAKKLGVESIYIEPLIWQNGPRYERFYKDNEILTSIGFFEVRKICGEITGVAKEEDIKVTSPYFDKLLGGKGNQISIKGKEDNPGPICTRPWTTIFISWNGEVRTCCGSHFVFGNLRTQPIEEIWNGPKFQSYRKQFINGEIPPSCENCLRNGRQENILQGIYHELFPYN